MVRTFSIAAKSIRIRRAGYIGTRSGRIRRTTRSSTRKKTCSGMSHWEKAAAANSSSSTLRITRQPRRDSFLRASLKAEFLTGRAPVRVVAPKKRWKTWLAHDIRRAVTGFVPSKDFIALTIREQGSEEIYISSPEGARKKVVFPEEGHTIALWDNLEYDSSYIRITY